MRQYVSSVFICLLAIAALASLTFAQSGPIWLPLGSFAALGCLAFASVLWLGARRTRSVSVIGGVDAEPARVAITPTASSRPPGRR